MTERDGTITRKHARTIDATALISGVRRGQWTCIEPGCWQLDRTDLRLEFDRQHGWCLWGEFFSVFPAGRGYGWSLSDAMASVEVWAKGWGWRHVRQRTRRTDPRGHKHG